MHVDSISPLSSLIESPTSQRGKSKQETSTTKNTERITEIFASTRAYPSWWSEIEEHRVLRRRRSIDDTVLERNLCFVDTPGYSQEVSIDERTDPILQYIEGQLSKTLYNANATEGELVSLLGGEGGSQVDLILYLMHPRKYPGRMSPIG